MESVLNPPASAIRIGRWWFKNRSLSPLPLFFLMLVLPPNFKPGAPATVLTILGIFLAEGLRIWAVGYAGSATRTRGETVPELVHAGPYLWVRNPLYVANILLYTLVSVLFGFSYLSVLIFLYSCVQYAYIVRFEESILTGIFGEPYLHYCRRVSRWLPGRDMDFQSSSHEFDLVRALKSERSTFYSILGMALLYVVKNFVISGT